MPCQRVLVQLNSKNGSAQSSFNWLVQKQPRRQGRLLPHIIVSCSAWGRQGVHIHGVLPVHILPHLARTSLGSYTLTYQMLNSKSRKKKKKKNMLVSYFSPFGHGTWSLYLNWKTEAVIGVRKGKETVINFAIRLQRIR